MKIILLIMLFMLFVVGGLSIYLYYKVKHLLYFDMVYVCNYLKNNITFNKDNLSLLISNLKENLHKSSIRILGNINDKQLFLKNEDRDNINNFFVSLGKGDVDYEINYLNYNEMYFKKMADASLEDVKNKGVLYMKLTIIFGISLIIILI